MTDKKIIELYWDRNETAISATKKKYGNYLYKIAHNILHTKEDCEEVLNETYLGAWKTMPPEKPNPLKTYLGRITRNISLNFFRHNSAKKRGGTQTDLALDELGEIFNSTEDVEEKIEREMLLEFIRNFIDKLEKDHRLIFLARYWYMYSVKDISKKLGFSESKVKTTLMRTRIKLKEELKKEGLI